LTTILLWINMDDEERVVLLGVVQEKQGVDGASPYVCKAGGRPVR
jgi:hypothetical protein